MLHLVYRIWINLGPSLWHFEGNTSGSIDIPMQELKALAKRIGFNIQVSTIVFNRYSHRHVIYLLRY